jgi:hypothetical protein
MRTAISYMVGSKVADGRHDEFNESFEGDLADIALEETKKIQEDKVLSARIFEKFQQREFNSIADFFIEIPRPDMSYLKWNRVTAQGYEEAHQSRNNIL